MDVKPISVNSSKEIKLKALSLETCPPHIVKNLVEDTDLDVKSKALSHVNCPPDVLDTVYTGTNNVNVHKIIAKNKKCSTELLLKITKNSDEEVRLLVAENPSSSEEVLEKLINDKNNAVVEAVVKHKNCTEALLLKLIEILDVNNHQIIWAINSSDQYTYDVGMALEQKINDAKQAARPKVSGHKYELTGLTNTIDGHTLYQIRNTQNGKLGGWIEKEENLSQMGSCWVEEYAYVYGDAVISGNAIVDTNSRVFGRAKVSGDAIIKNYSEIYGGAKISGSAQVNKSKIYENAQILDDSFVLRSKVYGSAIVSGGAYVYNGVDIYDNAKISDNAQVYESASVYGDARVMNSAQVFDGAQVFGSAVVKDTAKVYNANVSGDAVIEGTAEVDINVSTGTYSESEQSINVISEQLLKFCENIDNSSKMLIRCDSNSIQDFFDATVLDESVETTEILYVLSYETKDTLFQINKLMADADMLYTIRIETINKAGSQGSVSYDILHKGMIDKVLNSIIDTIRDSRDYYKYADDLENCLS